jgi:hypothetical protein
VAFNATAGKAATHDMGGGSDKTKSAHISDNPDEYKDSGLSKEELKEYQSKEGAGQTGHKFMKSINGLFAAQKLPIHVKADIVKKGGIYTGHITVSHTGDANAAKVVIDFKSLKYGSGGSSEFQVGETGGEDNYVVRACAEMIGKQIAKQIDMKYKAPWGTLLDKDAPTKDTPKDTPKDTNDSKDWKSQHQKTTDDWKAEHDKFMGK